jgi:hypothetical protein
MELKTTNLMIDSRDRDMRLYPEPNRYVVDLYDVLKNVVSVDLIYALYPKHGTEFYVNLNIDEVEQSNVGPNTHLLKAFAQLPLVSHINEIKNELRTLVELQRPIAKLAKFTISFTDHTGQLYDMSEHLLRFEIKSQIYDGNPIQPIGSVGNVRAKMLLRVSEHFTKKDLVNGFKMAAKDNPEMLPELKKAYRVLRQTLE